MVKFRDINCPHRRLIKKKSDICRGIRIFIFISIEKNVSGKYNCTEKFEKYKINIFDLILILGKIDSEIIDFGVYRKKKRVLRNCSFGKKKRLGSGLVDKTEIASDNLSAM